MVQLQKDLAQLNYSNGPDNGKIGPLTTTALKNFQQWASTQSFGTTSR